MKKLIVTLMGVACALSIVTSASAQDKKRPELTEEQKKLMKEMTDKYDTNKDGKLDKEERGKMSQEDKDKMSKAGLAPKKKDK
ncbi:MAG: hypothetical protein FJ386_12435 [Verrucomicrobia bacterium]|nr:hypothetical protein [Verrucomicrobiota bacterium]